MSKDGPVFEKFRVLRTDNTDGPGMKHHLCEYFVLDVSHDPYAMAALQAYAEACQITHPSLAADIRRQWIMGQEEGEAHDH